MLLIETASNERRCLSKGVHNATTISVTEKNAESNLLFRGQALYGIGIAGTAGRVLLICNNYTREWDRRANE